MAAKKSVPRSRPSTPARKKASAPRTRRAAGGTTTGCSYSQTWSPLTSTRGYVQVWVPESHYEKIAKHLLKKTKDRYARMLLRQKLAPLGVVSTCGGTCDGGWCQEHVIGENTFVCECGYFT